MEWQKIDRWRKQTTEACVEICHGYRDNPTIPGTDFQGQRINHWNIYAFIYPGHPLFSEIDLTDAWPDNIPMHGGCTYFKIHRDNGGKEILSLEIGCDYGHYQDDRFELMTTFEEASEVVADAERILLFLTQKEV